MKSRSSPHALARVIPHPNFHGPHTSENPIASASSAPSMYAAELCVRQAVTVAWLWDHPDTPAYRYDKDAAEMGLDPWRSIDGVNPSLSGSECELWMQNGACCSAKMDDVIFVSKKSVPPVIAAVADSRISNTRLMLLLDSAQVTKELIQTSAKRRKGGLTKWEQKLLSVAEKALLAA